VSASTSGRRSVLPQGVVGRSALGGVLFLIVGVVLAWFVFIPQSTQSVGNQKETDIAAAFEDGANALSSCTNQSTVAAQGALANAGQFDKIMQDAVSHTGSAAKYQLSDQKTGVPNQGAQQGLYALFLQAYPNTSGVTDLFRNAVDVATSCQRKYESAQTLVLDRVRDFDRWRTGGWTQRQFWSGPANDALIIPIPGTRTVLTGNQALSVARVPIVNTVTSSAYQSGTYNPANPFATSSAAATPSS